MNEVVSSIILRRLCGTSGCSRTHVAALDAACSALIPASVGNRWVCEVRIARLGGARKT